METTNFRKSGGRLEGTSATNLPGTFGTAHNTGMPQGTISLNRTVIGLMALICGIASAVLLGMMATRPENSGLIYTQGGLARMALVLGALWLAMPGRNREAAWANISPRFLALLLGAAIVMIRIPPRILIPLAIVAGVTIIILRPRPKRRPTGGL